MVLQFFWYAMNSICTFLRPLILGVFLWLVVTVGWAEGIYTDKHLIKNPNDSRLLNFNARIYDALTGRFITPDAVPNSNWYQYGQNNPQYFIDPTGHSSEEPDTAIHSAGDVGRAWRASYNRSIDILAQSQTVDTPWYETAGKVLLVYSMAIAGWSEFDDSLAFGEGPLKQDIVRGAILASSAGAPAFKLLKFSKPLPLSPIELETFQYVLNTSSEAGPAAQQAMQLVAGHSGTPKQKADLMEYLFSKVQQRHVGDWEFIRLNMADHSVLYRGLAGHSVVVRASDGKVFRGSTNRWDALRNQPPNIHLSAEGIVAHWDEMTEVVAEPLH